MGSVRLTVEAPIADDMFSLLDHRLLKDFSMTMAPFHAFRPSGHPSLLLMTTLIPFGLLVFLATADADPILPPTGLLTVEQSTIDGRLSETFSFPNGNQLIPLLKFSGPHILMPQPASRMEVLEDFEEYPADWQWTGLPPSVWTDSHRLGFLPHGRYFIETGIDSRDEFYDGFTGSILSPPIVLPYRYLSFMIAGGDKPDSEYVAILDAESGDELARFTGGNSDLLHFVTTDLSDHIGEPVRIEILDQDSGDWGHIIADYFVSHSDPSPEFAAELTWETKSPSEPGASTVQGHGYGIEVDRSLIPQPDGSVLVRETARATTDVVFLSYDDIYTFPHLDPDFIWSQSIKHLPEDLVPQWQFKSPAIIEQKGPLLAALVPDVEQLTAKSIEAAPPDLDLQNAAGTTPTLSYGVIQSSQTFHSIYSRGHQPIELKAGESLNRDHWLVLGGEESPRQGFRRVVRFLWQHFGHQALLNTPQEQRNFDRPQLALFDDWRQDVWHDYAGREYRQYQIDGQAVGTLVSNRVGLIMPGNPDDAEFQAWFQTLRTAYGWSVYAKRTGDDVLAQHARAILNLALIAPRNQGAFPIVFWTDEEGNHHWVNDNAMAGYADYYHAYDMAWTGYWLLRWIDQAPDAKTQIIQETRALGDFLLSKQRSDGYIPSWFNGDTLATKDEFSTFSAEVAGSALFLSELSRVTSETAYLEGARKAMDFVETQVLPENRWQDFETFLSCSQKPFDFYDPYTRQYPQSNLCQIQAAMACMSLFKATGEPHYLDLGTRVLDYLLLTQQVWNHPLQTPAMVGGFTVQNTDTEWSDARQAYCADLLFDYYDATGTAEYLERAVAALRATFAIAPYENWSHNGYENKHGSLTGINWGSGTAMTSVELAHDRYGDVFVDAATDNGVGINGCTLTNLKIVADTITFDLRSPFYWKRPATLVVRGATRPARILVNGWDLGQYAVPELDRGIEIPQAAMAGGPQTTVVFY